MSVCICEFEVTQRKNTLLLLLAHWSIAMSHSLIYNLSQCIAHGVCLCVRVRSLVHDSYNISAHSAVACVSRLTQHCVRVDNETSFERDATIFDRYGGSPFHSNQMRTHSQSEDSWNTRKIKKRKSVGENDSITGTRSAGYFYDA